MLARSNTMIVWTPIAVNEKSHVRGKKKVIARVLGGRHRQFRGSATLWRRARRSIVYIDHCALCHTRRCARVGRGEQNGHGLREPAPQRQLNRMRFKAFAAFIFILSMVAPNTAFGQNAYPTRPVKFLVPYPGGGTNDVLARIVGDKLQAKWGQPVI